MKPALLLIFAATMWAESACIMVDHSSVMASDLAAEIPEFQTIPADRHIVWAPAPGLTRWLRAADLQKIGAREGILVSNAATVCIQRKTIVFSQDQVVSALRERLPAGADLRVSDYCRLPRMSGRLRFETRPLARPGSGKPQLLWRGVVAGDDHRTVPFWAIVEIGIDRRIVRTTRPIPANATLSRDDLVETTERTAIIDSGPLPGLSDLIGRETVRSINPRQIVQLAWLRVPPLIRKGQSVRVIVQSGGATLGLEAQAMSGGNQGDTVLVKNNENGRTFRAEITGPGRVAIRMESQSK